MSPKTFVFQVSIALGLLGGLAFNATAGEALLERDVLPILTKNCLGCHGGLRQQGKLDLRTLPAMLKGGEAGSALKSGDAKASTLWTRIVADEMPEGDKKLTAEEKAIIKSWIDSGLPTVSQRQGKIDPILTRGQSHAPVEVAATIDRHLEDFLSAAKLKPSAASDDAEFMRRAYLDLTGRVPTAKQAAEFLDDAGGDRRAKLIDTLLATPEYGEHFGRTWREWISPPELPSDMNGGKQPHREAVEFGKWLGKKFAAGESWDKIVRDILMVSGEIKNNPQVIFFGLVGENGKSTPDGAARATASLFLGVQLQCAQCHDDPYRDWSQRDHWGLAAFFGRSEATFQKMEPGKGPSKKPGEIVIPASAFKNSGTAIPAKFLRGDGFQAGKIDDPRAPLVTWMTASDNPYFAKAFANRLWSYFFARGLVHPVDDFRELNPPSHPGLIQLLGNEFADSGYDIKHLIRCICGSQAYQRTSRVARGTNDVASAALTSAFGRMPLRVMPAESLYDSLRLAYGDPKLDLRAIGAKENNTAGESAPVGDESLEFRRRFGTNEDDPTDFTHGISQMLTMINHPRLLAGSKALEEYLKKNARMSAENVIEWLYLSTLSRRPTSTEAADATAFIAMAKEPAAAYASLLWTLINRTEFLLIR